MKLRIRSTNAKETIRVEISSSSSLRDLKILIADRLASETSPDAIHFSLNRSEELPEETLASLGIASGDLIFYSLDASAFSPSSRTLDPTVSGETTSGSLRAHHPSEEKTSAADKMDQREKATGDLEILVTAARAVFLELGFALISEKWTSEASTVSISCSLPDACNPNFPPPVEEAELKILPIGKHAVLYGHLIRDSNLRRICMKDEKTVSEIRRSVKDEIAFPLLIDLCLRKGFPLPPCFSRLPPELKIRILEVLPGADLARAACVSSELRRLASNDDLWRQKFAAEFSSAQATGSNWREKFADRWIDRKRRNALRAEYFGSALRRRDRAQFPAPGFNVIGGDYDLYPGFRRAYPRRYRQGMSDNVVWGQRSFMPHCNFGGFNA